MEWRRKMSCTVRPMPAFLHKLVHVMAVRESPPSFRKFSVSFRRCIGMFKTRLQASANNLSVSLIGVYTAGSSSSSPLSANWGSSSISSSHFAALFRSSLPDESKGIDSTLSQTPGTM